VHASLGLVFRMCLGCVASPAVLVQQAVLWCGAMSALRSHTQGVRPYMSWSHVVLLLVPHIAVTFPPSTWAGPGWSPPASSCMSVMWGMLPRCCAAAIHEVMQCAEGTRGEGAPWLQVGLAICGCRWDWPSSPGRRRQCVWQEQHSGVGFN
jgi:hypothetical protein